LEVAVGVASLATFLGVFLAWHLFRERKALAELKAQPELEDLHIAIQTLIAPLNDLHGTDWVFSRLMLREADVVFWEVAQQTPDQRDHVIEHLRRLSGVTSASQIEHVLQSVRMAVARTTSRQ
jgi:hypothetical protein